MNRSNLSAPATIAPVETHAPVRAPTGVSLFRLGAFRRDPLDVLESAWHGHGDVVRLKLGPLEMHLAVHPDDVQRVLVDNNKNYDKQAVGYSKLRLALGEGLLTSEGDFWRRQRRIMQPSFHRDRLQQFGSVIVSHVDEMLDEWGARADRGEVLDVAKEMMRVTLGIIGTTMFSTDLSGEASRLGEYMTVAIEYVNDRMLALTALWDFPEKLPTAQNRRFREVLRAGDELLFELIAARRGAGDEHGDLLGMLMAVRDEETGETMTDRQLRDEAITIFGAGHETTANALTWLWHLLARHPGVAEALRREVDEVLGGRPPTALDLPRLEWTALVVKEAMRLYPPAWIMSRRAIGGDVLGGCEIPAGSTVLLSPYLTHRHPAFWEEPDAFRPERLRADSAARAHRYAYFPFGGGPRLCIGAGFAMMEAQLIVARIVQRFELDADPAHVVEKEPLVTLRPKGGVHMSPRRRAPAPGQPR